MPAPGFALEQLWLLAATPARVGRKLCQWQAVCAGLDGPASAGGIADCVRSIVGTGAASGHSSQLAGGFAAAAGLMLAPQQVRRLHAKRTKVTVFLAVFGNRRCCLLVNYQLLSVDVRSSFGPPVTRFTACHDVQKTPVLEGSGDFFVPVEPITPTPAQKFGGIFFQRPSTYREMVRKSFTHGRFSDSKSFADMPQVPHRYC